MLQYSLYFKAPNLTPLTFSSGALSSNPVVGWVLRLAVLEPVTRGGSGGGAASLTFAPHWRAMTLFEITKQEMLI